MNLCKDCKYYNWDRSFLNCCHPNNIIVSPIDGADVTRLGLWTLRSTKSEGFCGPDGDWWESKVLVIPDNIATIPV
jgi:hypothetical protein